MFANSNEQVPGKIDSLPAVFLIGENEAGYSEMMMESKTLLLSVCQDSMEQAFELWMTMLSDMEILAKDLSFDINGIKIWINVFWNPDGTIEHIVYYPKPTSRNLDYAELTAFFKVFIEKYRFDKACESPYSHYGSASFPTFVKRPELEKKQ